MPTICVLGGTGFLGSHLVKSLETDRRFNVKILSRRPPDRFPRFTRGQVIQGDLLNPDSVTRFLEPGAVVINLAYIPDRSPDENLQSTRNLAHACTTVGVSRLIHVSTAVVVGGAAEDVITEETTCRPVTQYEKTKLEIEQVLLSRLAGCCDVGVLRPTEVFGSGGAGLVRLATQVRDASWIVGLKCALFGRRRLHLIYVDNVVAAVAFLAFADESVNGECFLVSDDEVDQNTYAGVVRVLADAFGLPHVPRTGWEAPSVMLSGLLRLAGRSDTNPRRVYRCDKLLHAGFRKPVPFEDGVRRFAEWFKSGEHAVAPI